MNWLDFIIGGVALLGLFVGWKMGLLGAIFNALGVLFGAFFAARFSDDIASWFVQHGTADAIATVLAYVVIVAGLFLAAQLARRIVRKVLDVALLGWVDTMGSVVIGVVFGLALSAALILAVVRLSSDLPEQGAGGAAGRTSGLRGAVQDAAVESAVVPGFIAVVHALPGEALGFIPGDFALALKQVEERIQRQRGS